MKTLAYRAAIALKKRARINRGLNITLYKNIPMGAGLGGGSADAATVLTALNRIWNLQISRDELAAIAVELGSDVPFCLQGGTALARGRGEILERWPSLPFSWLVLARPAGLVIHTGGVYRKLPRELPATTSGYDRLRRHLERGDRENILNWLARDCVNMLEEIIFRDNTSLDRLKNLFRESGLLPLMSGSGPVMFALTDSLEMAHAVVFILEQEGYEAWISWTL